MSELELIKKALDEAHVPREVWIGTDSTADRVTWVLGRLEVLKRGQSARNTDPAKCLNTDLLSGVAARLEAIAKSLEWLRCGVAPESRDDYARRLAADIGEAAEEAYGALGWRHVKHAGD